MIHWIKMSLLNKRWNIEYEMTIAEQKYESLNKKWVYWTNYGHIEYNMTITEQKSPCEQSLVYRFFEETEKEALHKSASSSEVAVAPNLELVIPVYGCQTGFTSASINFYEKPMVETEPTGYKENMAAKRWQKEFARKC